MMVTRNSLIIAVDGGGTGSRAAIVTQEGRKLATSQGGFANLTTDFETSRHHLMETIERAYQRAGLPSDRMAQDVGVFGIAGANAGTFSRQLEQSLPMSALRVVSDREIAVRGALGTSDGLVALIGTGSTFAAQTGGQLRFAGGWGFALGDDGSGAALGQAVLRQSLLAFDGVIEPSPLSNHILNHFGHPDAMVRFAQSARPGDYAQFTNDLLEFWHQDDPIALEILRQASEQIAHILEKLGALQARKLCWLGGLGPTYKSLLDKRFGPISAEPEGTSIDGAITLALEWLAASDWQD